MPGESTAKEADQTMELQPEENLSNRSNEDCNLSDTEEEKTQVQHSSQRKALLSIEKILNQIKSEVGADDSQD